MDRLFEAVEELLELGVGDEQRLLHIKDSLQAGKELFNSDQRYIESLAEKHLAKDEPAETAEPARQARSEDQAVKSAGTGRGSKVAIAFLGVMVLLLGVGLLSSLSTFAENDRLEYALQRQTNTSNQLQDRVDSMNWQINDLKDQVRQSKVTLDEQIAQSERERAALVRLSEQQLAEQIALTQQQLAEQQQKSNLALEKQRSYTNPVIAGLLNGNLTYYIQPLPRFSTYDVSSFDDYLNGRNIEGIKLTRVFDESKADFSVWWVKDYGPEHLGVAYSKTTATVGLGRTNCSGEWQHFDDWTITRVAWHEIGHVLGYDHSDDPNNIMYPRGLPQYNHDIDVKKVIAPGWHTWYYFCSNGEQHYSFSTDKEDNLGFRIFVVTSETDVSDFVYNNDGRYYPNCGESDKRWISKSETCNPGDGAKLVIHNPNDRAIRIEGYIEDRSPHPKPNMSWDDDFYAYDQKYLDYVRALSSR